MIIIRSKAENISSIIYFFNHYLNEEDTEYDYNKIIDEAIKNNYDIEWTKSIYGKPDEDGEGIFNGDIGTILKINSITKFMTVIFDDERVADYNFTQLEELELAYCISIHKSQGSEFPCVVLPLMNGPIMLMNRNILYTAVTRARSNVFILGSTSCIEGMVQNMRVKKRYSALEFFLKELHGGIE